MRWLSVGLLLTSAVACGPSASDPSPRAASESVDGRASASAGASAAEAGAEARTANAKGDPEATSSPAEPGVRPDGEIVSAVAWFEGSLEQALTRAEAEGKLVFVDVGAYWCPPCHRLDEEVFVQPAVGERLGQGYVAVHVDAEKGEGPELVERYRVQAYPTILVLEPTGIEKARIVDFLPAEQLLATLERIAAGGNVLEQLALAVEHDPDDLAKRFELAHAYLLAADAEAARPHLDAVLVGDEGNGLGLASRALYDRALFATYKLEGKTEAAIEQFAALQRTYPDSKEAVRAYRHIGRLLHTLGRDDEAVASLAAMVATNPEDPALASSFGWFSFRQQCRPQAGLEAVRKGLVLAPDDADLHYLQAELLHLLGQDQAALVSIRKASALEPKTAFYRRQIRRFEALTGAMG